MEPAPFQRSVAVKVAIQEILQSNRVQDEQGTFPRVNIMATILQKEILGNMSNFLIDDGTGTLLTRFFESQPHLEHFKIGDSVIVIGKVRAYNQEKYLSPEIMKKISPAWLKVRKVENLLSGKMPVAMQKLNAVQNENSPVKVNRVSEELVAEAEIFSEGKNLVEELPQQKIMALIKELDPGNGAPIQEIIEKSPLQDTEFLLDKMMECGEIFQILPGRVKVL
ncbi:OB-fold nucleic acid binding domain-containing protein [Candidatus Woesearchaeota archaeon]|nr:OB-fold nucleic acid binding domain-containing protein [Candidatus Woesearchaeota archaeon]